jgi:hypothetical protein
MIIIMVMMMGNEDGAAAASKRGHHMIMISSWFRCVCERLSVTSMSVPQINKFRFMIDLLPGPYLRWSLRRRATEVSGGSSWEAMRLRGVRRCCGGRCLWMT